MTTVAHGLEARPAEYERRVVDLLARSLLDTPIERSTT